METIEIARLCATYADEKKAENIVLLDLRGLSPVTDFFVICTASSNPQMRAVRDQIVAEMRDTHGLKPMFSEGGFESQWLIVNYPNVMVHILTPEKREFYALEELWGDAPFIPWTPPAPPKKVAVKKTAAKKAPATKAPATKAPVTKVAAKKVPAKKAAAKTVVAEKAPAKKAVVEKTVAKKAPAQKAAAKTVVTETVVAKKAAVKKTAAKKAAKKK